MNLFDGFLHFVTSQLANLLGWFVGLLPDSPLTGLNLGPLASFGAIVGTFIDISGITAFAAAYAVCLVSFVVFRLIFKFFSGGGFLGKLLSAAGSIFGG